MPMAVFREAYASQNTATLQLDAWFSDSNAYSRMLLTLRRITRLSGLTG
jgi:hypothetical protein